jgi:hypothetical protein
MINGAIQEGNVMSLEKYKAQRAEVAVSDERPWAGGWLIWRQNGDQVEFLSLSATEESAQTELGFLNREWAPCGGGWKATPIMMAGFSWEAKVKALAEYRESPEAREAQLEAFHQSMALRAHGQPKPPGTYTAEFLKMRERAE